MVENWIVVANNAIQRHAAVILQKSLREGFGLTATEAMWKGTAVIAGNCGGLKHQIEDGVNGYRVSTVSEAGERIARLLKDEKLRKEIGSRAQKTVRERFLMTRLIEQYLDLFSAFEPNFAVNRQTLEALGQPRLGSSPITLTR